MSVIKFVSSGGSPVQVSEANPLPVSGGGGGGSDTEFPAATLTTDNFVNPTTTDVKSFGMLWDGSAWDRAPGNSTDGILVNLGANNDVTNVGKAATSSTNNAASVTTSTTQIIGANANRSKAVLFNNGSVTAYISKTGGTTSNAMPLVANGAMVWDSQEAVFGITVSGTADIRYIDYTI